MTSKRQASKREREARQWRQLAAEQRKAANLIADLARLLALDDVVQPDVTKTGRMSMRCSVCGKVSYTTREAALRAKDKIPDPMYAYLAPCGFWHLSTQRQPKEGRDK